MSSEHTEHFDLSELILGYLEDAGSIVMPPAFGVYDVLMPEEVAAQLALAEETHFAFAARSQEKPNEQVLNLSVNHPVVENIAHTLTQHPANTCSYIRDVRIDKRGLAELARKQYNLPNARIDALPRVQEEGQQHFYLLYNFKVTFVSEEKQEELVTVVMDVQAGHAVRDPLLLRRLEIIDPEPFYADLPMASPRWNAPAIGEKATLSVPLLQALLPRTEQALRQQLSEQVATLKTRMERHLILDLARINDYYDEMASDLQKRQSRTSEEEVERRQGFEDKMNVLQAERQAKLQDAESRYSLRVEMQLINLLLVSQAKVVLPVSISNRTVSITRSVVWDPLLHWLEPLVCDVCGEPGDGLQLCSGGHLAHEKCLAPQCVDCKRVFCQCCADQISECVVCHRPICKPSLIKCPTCGRGTCSEHQQLCHAAEGQPIVLPPTPQTPPPPKAAPKPESVAPPPPPAATKPSPSKATAGKASGGKPTTKSPAAPPASGNPPVKGVRIDMQISDRDSTIVAFVMRSTNRVLATRSFELTEQGIFVRCECEKSPCPANSYYHRPAPPAAFQAQIEAQLQKLQQEYWVPGKKVKYYYQEGSQIQEVKRLVLPASWRDPERIVAAIRGFDEMVKNQRR